MWAFTNLYYFLFHLETVNVGCFLFNANKQKMIQGKIECLPCSSPLRLTVGNMNLSSEAEPTQNWASFSKYQKNKSKKSSSTGREGNDTSKTPSKRNAKANAMRNPSTTVNRLNSSSRDVKNSVADDTRGCKTNARNDNTNNVGNKISNAQSTQKDLGARSSNSNTKEKPSTIDSVLGSNPKRNAENLHAPSGNASAGNDNVKDAKSTRKENIGAGRSKKRKGARRDGDANVKGNISNTSSTQNGNVNAGDDKTKPKGTKPNTKNANSETKNSKSNSNKSSTNSNASNTTSKKKPRKGRAKNNKSKRKQNVKNNPEEMNEVNDGQKGTLLLTSVNNLFATFKLPMQIILPMLIILLTIIAYNIQH